MQFCLLVASSNDGVCNAASIEVKVILHLFLRFVVDE
jgi:hypothetical protein